MERHKVIFLLWEDREIPRDQRPGILLGRCAPMILAAGAEKLVCYIADRDSDVRGPSPKPLFEKLIDASVEAWIDPGAVSRVSGILAGEGFRCAAYRVDESVYREYGGNRHMGPRDWPDGHRSPGIVSVNLLRRPAKIPRDEWITRWHTIMSPESEEIQPRGRYVRNAVTEILTPGAPVLDGIVIEAWPSPRHVSNPYLFYGASNPLQLVRNMVRILKAVRSFLRVREVRTVMMSEYFVRTDYGAGS
ncbi:MAG: hypothetical protein JXA20_07285 [Spirochaetes bacterium]|nr:hypothetical protein [Spirochaetota bacterium]